MLDAHCGDETRQKHNDEQSWSENYGVTYFDKCYNGLKQLLSQEMLQKVETIIVAKGQY